MQQEKDLQTEDLKQEEITTQTENLTDNNSAKDINVGETAENELENLKSELAEMKDKYLRLYSEFENYRRRTSKEKLDLIKSANEDLMSVLLPVIDDFERAQDAFEKNASIDTMKEGIQLIYNKFVKVLEQKNLVPMPVEKGNDFDADKHEAITSIPLPDGSLKGKVVDVVEKGYYLGDKVIRFAKVVTGS